MSVVQQCLSQGQPAGLLFAAAGNYYIFRVNRAG